MLPTDFRPSPFLRRLNIAAVSLTLAAGSAATFGVISSEFSGLIVGVPTLLLGAVWVWGLGIPKTIGDPPVRWGWLASLPLAAANGGLIAGATAVNLNCGPNFGGLCYPIGRFLRAAALGATVGVIAWGPALVATLVFFGAPLAWSEALARRGLSARERGQRTVGSVCAVLAAVTLSVALWSHDPTLIEDIVGTYGSRDFRGALVDLTYGPLFTKVAAALGIAMGLASAWLGHARERGRRTFVAKVDAGEIHGFRVDSSQKRKVLVRESPYGEGYRGANLSEEVFLLDEGTARKKITYIAVGVGVVAFIGLIGGAIALKTQSDKQAVAEAAHKVEMAEYEGKLQKATKDLEAQNQAVKDLEGVSNAKTDVGNKAVEAAHLAAKEEQRKKAGQVTSFQKGEPPASGGVSKPAKPCNCHPGDPLCSCL